MQSHRERGGHGAEELDPGVNPGSSQAEARQVVLQLDDDELGLGDVDLVVVVVDHAQVEERDLLVEAELLLRRELSADLVVRAREAIAVARRDRNFEVPVLDDTACLQCYP